MPMRRVIVETPYQADTEAERARIIQDAPLFAKVGT